VEEQVLDCGEAAIASSSQIFDPRCLQTKGAPRKLCKKGPLETNTKKTKVCFIYFLFTSKQDVMLGFPIVMVVNFF